MTAIQIILITIAIIVIWAILAFNTLISRRNRVKEAWSDIQVQLKRRYDLIPNLVNTVKGYAVHEKEVFEEVTQARTKAFEAKDTREQAEAENILTSALRHLFAVAEAYPELKASENFKKLQDELTDTEDKIQAARRFYNSTVLELNVAIEQFPTNIIAKAFDLKKEEFFELEEGKEEKQIEVKF